MIGKEAKAGICVRTLCGKRSKMINLTAVGKRGGGIHTTTYWKFSLPFHPHYLPIRIRRNFRSFRKFWEKFTKAGLLLFFKVSSRLVGCINAERTKATIKV